MIIRVPGSLLTEWYMLVVITKKESQVMKSRYEFLSKLRPGDIVTTSGVPNVPDGKAQLVTGCGEGKWRKFARVSDISESVKKSSDIGVRFEGIVPNVRDLMWNATNANDKEPAYMRRASASERAAFMKEYVKTRCAIIDHKIKENKEEAKVLRKNRKDLGVIANNEGIVLE